jgi:hypothetical protein
MNSKEKPLRATIKVKLEDILFKNNINYDNFRTTISKVNKIIFVGYMFIRSFILYCIESEQPAFTIDEKFIRIAFSHICAYKKKKVKVKKEKNYETKKEKEKITINNIDDYVKVLIKDYFKIFKKMTGFIPIEVSKVCYILGEAYKQIMVEITNNIILNYEKYIWNFVKLYYQDLCTRVKELHSPENLKCLYKQLNEVKLDILGTDKLRCDKNYPEIMKFHFKDIMPLNYSATNFKNNVKNNIFAYLKCMCFMNKKFQEAEIKSYQIFPLKTSYSNNHITINSSAFIDMFYDQFDTTMPKKECRSKSGDQLLQDNFWNQIFSLKKNQQNPKSKYKYKRSGYSFNYQIETDGYCVSLSMIRNDQVAEKESKKKNFAAARIKSNKNKEKLTEKDYQKFINDKKEAKEEKEDKELLLSKGKKKKKQAEYKALSKEEQEQVKNKLSEKDEFPYINKILTTISKRSEFKTKFNEGKILVCDPGKRSILYLMATNNVIHENENDKSSNCYGISIDGKETNGMGKHKFMKYSEKRDIWKGNKFLFSKNTKTLKDLEAELSKLNSKSCDHDEFIKYIVLKFECMKLVDEKYDIEYLQKLKWFSHLNKIHHENELVKQISNEFGKDVTIVIGDWSGKGRIKFAPTPNIALKRKLKEHFDVYFINEFRTSKVHYKHDIACNNMIVEDKKITDSDNTPIEKRFKYLHPVLTYQIVSKSMGQENIVSGCINRDKNSVLNMERIVKSLIETCDCPDIFKYGINVEKSPKKKIKKS